MLLSWLKRLSGMKVTGLVVVLLMELLLRTELGWFAVNRRGCY